MKEEPMDWSDWAARNAAAVQNWAREQFGVELRFDEDGLRWAEDYIERTRGGVGDETRHAMVAMFGAFLGECVRLNHGGYWCERDGAPGLCFETPRGTSTAFPMAKVGKLFDNGLEGGDSIVSFYRVIPFMLSGALEKG